MAERKSEQARPKSPKIWEAAFEQLGEAALRQTLAAAAAGAPFAPDGTLLPQSEWTEEQRAARLIVTETFMYGKKVEERRQFNFAAVDDGLELMKATLPKKAVELIVSPERAARKAREKEKFEAMRDQFRQHKLQERSAREAQRRTELRSLWDQEKLKKARQTP